MANKIAATTATAEEETGSQEVDQQATRASSLPATTMKTTATPVTTAAKPEDSQESPVLMDASQHAVPTALTSITVSSRIRQRIHICAAHKRPRLLLHYLETIQDRDLAEKKRQRSGVIVFCNTIKTVKYVGQLLAKHGETTGPGHTTISSGKHGGKKGDSTKSGYKYTLLHGQLPQQRREEQLNDFKSVRYHLLHILAVVSSSELMSTV